jgi:hypothetical protein
MTDGPRPIEPRRIERLRALAALAPRLEAQDAAGQFGAWVPSRQTAPNAWTMPYVEYGPLEQEFRAAITGWVRPDIDWMAWGETPDALALRREPARLERATAEDLDHLLTALVRGDRFNEGLLLDAFQEGLIARIARRAGALAASLAEEPHRAEEPPR